jgi:hypothetical protein
LKQITPKVMAALIPVAARRKHVSVNYFCAALTFAQSRQAAAAIPAFPATHIFFRQQGPQV